MTLTDEKIKKLEEMNSDYANLILKFVKYLSQDHTLCESAREKVLADRIPKCEHELCLIFSKEEYDVTNGYFMPQTEFMRNNQKNADESYYYSGKKLDDRQNMDYIPQNLKDKLLYAKTVIVGINIKDISSYPLWNTQMRRKMTGILKMVNSLEIDDIKEKKLVQILETTALEPVQEEKYYELDYLISVFKFLKLNHKDFQVFYIGKIDDFSREEIFLLNELEKFIFALKCEEKKYRYIYDEVCNDLDNMFSKFGFCDFKDNKCISQRHKKIFKNHYPIPKRNGCCFNVYRKCAFLNKDGSCKTKCLACKLYTCPFLGNLNIGTMTSEILLLRSFFNNKQKKDAIYQFFTPPEKAVKSIERNQNK